MRFIFIGASGFVGRHAMAHAAARGHEVIGTQSAARHPNLLKFNLLEDRLPEVLGKRWRDSDTPVYGVVCASVRQIDRCFRERERTRPINVEKTILAIHDLLDLGFRAVFLSTSYVFSGRRGNYSENDQRDPICEYGRQKAAVEEYLTTKLPQALILRLDKIVGDDPAEEHLFTEWLRWIRSGRPITCIAGQKMCPTLVDDIARALVTACEKGLQGLYNTANPQSIEREELARQFVDILGKQAEIIPRPQSFFNFLDPRPMDTTLDSSRFIQATGMQFTPMKKVIEVFARKAGLQPRPA